MKTGHQFQTRFWRCFQVQLCFACFEGLEARPTDTQFVRFWAPARHAQGGKLQKRFWPQLKVHCLLFTSFGGPKRVLSTIPCFEFQSFTPRVYVFMGAYYSKSTSSEEEQGAKPYLHFPERVQNSWCHNVHCMFLLRCWCCKPQNLHNR